MWWIQENLVLHCRPIICTLDEVNNPYKSQKLETSSMDGLNPCLQSLRQRWKSLQSVDGVPLRRTNISTSGGTSQAVCYPERAFDNLGKAIKQLYFLIKLKRNLFFKLKELIMGAKRTFWYTLILELEFSIKTKRRVRGIQLCQ